MKEFTAKDVPDEVMWVWAMNFTGLPVGMDVHRKCQEIIKKYPDWFKDEKNEDNKN